MTTDIHPPLVDTGIRVRDEHRPFLVDSKPSSLFKQFQAKKPPSIPSTTDAARGNTFVISDMRWFISLLTPFISLFASGVGALVVDTLGLQSTFCTLQGVDGINEQRGAYQEASEIDHERGKYEAVAGMSRNTLLLMGGVIFCALRIAQITQGIMTYAVHTVVPEALTTATTALLSLGCSIFAGFFVILGAWSAFKLKRNYTFKKELKEVLAASNTDLERNLNVFRFLKEKLTLNSKEKLKTITPEEIEKLEKKAAQGSCSPNKRTTRAKLCTSICKIN